MHRAWHPRETRARGTASPGLLRVSLWLALIRILVNVREGRPVRLMRTSLVGRGNARKQQGKGESDQSLGAVGCVDVAEHGCGSITSTRVTSAPSSTNMRVQLGPAR